MRHEASWRHPVCAFEDARRVASVQAEVRGCGALAEEERNMELAIAASNIDQYKTWGELPDDLKNLITKKIVSSRSPPSTLPSTCTSTVPVQEPGPHRLLAL